MGAARRLYTYAVSAVSLGVLAFGVVLLLSRLLDEIARLLGLRVLLDTLTREDVSLAIALIAVAGPIFAIHWWFATRGLQGESADAVDERTSAIRALYFSVVQLVAFSAALAAGYQLLRGVFELLLGVDESSLSEASRVMAILLVAGLVWTYHAQRRQLEMYVTPMRGAAMWLTRLSRYAGAFIGLMVALQGVAATIDIVLQTILDEPALGTSNWWHDPMSSGLAMAVVGTLGWALHWRAAERAVRDAPIIGEDERQARLRGVYVAGVLLVALVVAAQHLYSSLDVLFGWLLGRADAGDVIGPDRPLRLLLAGVLPYAAAGALLVRYRLRELAPVGVAAVLAAKRQTAHLVGLVGLGSLAGGAWRTLDTVLHAVVDGPTLGGADIVLADLAPGMALLAVGALLWLPAWTWVLRRRAESAVTERSAVVSRVYLYLVLASSLIAAIPAAALVLFRLINVLLGVTEASLGEQLATPVSVLVVAAVVAAYHAMLLRADVRPLVPALGHEVAASVPPPPSMVAVPLVLRAPVGMALGAVLAAMRTSLPAGMSLEQPTAASDGPTTLSESARHPAT